MKDTAIVVRLDAMYDRKETVTLRTDFLKREKKKCVENWQGRRKKRRPKGLTVANQDLKNCWTGWI